MIFKDENKTHMVKKTEITKTATAATTKHINIKTKAITTNLNTSSRNEAW